MFNETGEIPENEKKERQIFLLSNQIEKLEKECIEKSENINLQTRRWEQEGLGRREVFQKRRKARSGLLEKQEELEELKVELSKLLPKITKGDVNDNDITRGCLLTELSLKYNGDGEFNIKNLYQGRVEGDVVSFTLPAKSTISDLQDSEGAFSVANSFAFIKSGKNRSDSQDNIVIVVPFDSLPKRYHNRKKDLFRDIKIGVTDLEGIGGVRIFRADSEDSFDNKN